jgi:hypothetical protein
MDVFYQLNDLFKSIPQFIKRAFILSVRLTEYTLIGQSEYTIYKREIAEFETVVDKLKAKTLEDQVISFLCKRLGVSLRRPVITDLYSGNEFDWKGIIMELRGDLGRYHMETMGKLGLVHMIYIRSGLSKNRFMSILAHEMAHAFLREEKLLNKERFLREGFARWVEYHFLLELGEKPIAEKLTQIKTLRGGREILKFLSLEHKLGMKGVMEAVRQMK